MIDVPAYDSQGRPTESVGVDEAALGGEVRMKLLRNAVEMYERRCRVGTRGGRTRSQVAGSGQKMYRQKGTGLARAGQRQVAQRRGGGVAFSLRGRVFHARLPRKAQRRALHSALLARLQDGEAKVVDMPELEEPRTRVVADLLKAIGAVGSVLLVTDEQGPKNQTLSARNIKGCEVCRVQDLNPRGVLKPEHVVFTRTALDRLIEGLNL